jgi:signal recognition particle subunit SEC65
MVLSKTKIQQGLHQKSVALAIPKKVSIPYCRLFGKWVHDSGAEWTVDRFKAIKLDIIRKKAGLPPVSSWISRTKNSFSGPIGLLERWMFRKESNFNRGIQLLQAYTMFYADQVTEKQKNKFLSGVLSQQPNPDAILLANEIAHKGLHISSISRRKELKKPTPLERRLSSPQKRAPLPDRSVDERDGIIDSIRFLYDTFEGISHMNRYYESHYKFCLQNLENALFNDYGHFMSPKGYPYPLETHGSLLAGRIGLIQESGYKLRAVANPGRVFQEVLKPLGDAIYDILRDLPWDCTHDQSKGFPVLQERIRQGKIVHSIDLTGATDYFPLSVQVSLLKRIFPKEDVNLFEELSKSSWFMPNHGEIQWTRGQPLGLFPSFGAFALTHGVLLLGLLGKPWDNDFFILGDDVVILSDKLAEDYFQLMLSLGCPISTSKSLSSDSLCEFGGKIITPFNVVSQLKWRDVSDDSFLDIAKLLGPKSIGLFKPRQCKVIKLISEIPDFFGGMGWNPKGKPLEDRITLALKLQQEKPVDHLMGYSSTIIRNALSSELFGLVIFKSGELDIDDATFDKKVSRLIKEILGRSFASFDRSLLGKNIDWVNMLTTGEHVDLPINPGEVKGLRPSLLMSWEAKLCHLK